MRCETTNATLAGLLHRSCLLVMVDDVMVRQEDQDVDDDDPDPPEGVNDEVHGRASFHAMTISVILRIASSSRLRMILCIVAVFAAYGSMSLNCAIISS